MAETWTIGVDVGGTFTDLCAIENASGRIALNKVSSTPANPAEAIIAGLDALAKKAGFDLADVRAIGHGTTVATNALIQRTGAKVAMVTTRNFRDLVEIGRQIRPKMYDLKADFPPPLAPRHLRFEVSERIGADGTVIEPLDMGSVDAVIEALRAEQIEAVAIAFLFAYLNPSHEQAVKAQITAALPGVAVSASSDVMPEFREYERSSTTLLNAYLQPAFADYMRTLEREVAARSPASSLGVNQSSGGLMSVETAREFPIRTAMSGPAAGANGAIHTAMQSGIANVITFDVGGTSADVALIRDRTIGLAFDRDVAEFPVRMPMVDINTVGAGGGSLAWFDRDGLMKVGPASAGARPGPACYGRGGDQATVTDANVVLGRLSTSGLLGGDMSLDVDASFRVVGKVAEQLGVAVETAARGILDVMAANMVRAIRAISVERGHDPRDFALMPFGGAGPLHAEACARALGIRQVLVPLLPGILCAEGLLVAGRSESLVRSQRIPLTEAAGPTLSRLADEMRAEAGRWFEAEAIPEAERSEKLVADMRYTSQNYELQIPVGGNSVTDLDALKQAFFEAHAQAYGFFNPDDPVEVMALRMTPQGARPQIGSPPQSATASRAPRPKARRPVWFNGPGALDTPVYDRAELAAGTELTGPAVIDQFDSTLLLFPGDGARVDDALNILITRGETDQ
ncbi:hydantoinase/oxoprolinase family protein [Ponticoccus alexandrii]|uniref:Hydantoinase/oxoprolinase family protein n=1 Tax=Ponticoccus alexandrii TaxID=1943633 RepID=A0ABX7FG06_9RHOB|nr:hydantoinase/oxoprolinase family protein [Ponticoccus alexandrii]ETA49654.1 N-methylhydantoinase [Rhodobacteraceae bacterium PD-2]QRF68866.1 hydantoinase/oxoprolinase family protein [Ponticoccus alexandrii]